VGTQAPRRAQRMRRSRREAGCRHKAQVGVDRAGGYRRGRRRGRWRGAVGRETRDSEGGKAQDKGKPPSPRSQVGGKGGGVAAVEM
jgi:hypothetical protein